MWGTQADMRFSGSVGCIGNGESPMLSITEQHKRFQDPGTDRALAAEGVQPHLQVLQSFSKISIAGGTQAS